MKKFEFKSLPNGFLYLIDELGNVYYPSNDVGARQDISDYSLVDLISDGQLIYSVQFLTKDQSLGWLIEAIQVAGKVVSSVAQAVSNKKQAQAAAQQAESQAQAAAAAAQQQSLILQSQVPQDNGFSAGEIIIAAIGGIGLIGGIIFLVSNKGKEKSTKKK